MEDLLEFCPVVVLELLNEFLGFGELYGGEEWFDRG